MAKSSAVKLLALISETSIESHIAIAAVVAAMLQLMIKAAQMNDWFPAACQSIVACNAGLYLLICTITLASRKLIAL